VNTILNYVYPILEGQASIDARVSGLDPGLGVLHADQPNRDSLAADLEPIRTGGRPLCPATLSRADVRGP
jgi:CRISPR/Cas system-associated endonuclease Cas1